MHPEQILKAIDELWELTQNPCKPASEIINEYTNTTIISDNNDLNFLKKY